ncbi:MAG: hypothetical protein M1457_05090 [bacterium]|nr:hypothetical protein [bacterium]
MAEKSNDVNRREFIKMGSGALAVGAGLFTLGGGDAPALAPRGGLTEGWSLDRLPAAPRRLSDLTHELARRGLSGEIGRTMKDAGFGYDEARVKGMTPDQRYAEAIRLIAENAPLRIQAGERIVGSATLREAPTHRTPVHLEPSTSHLTLGFERGLSLGYRGLRAQIEARLARGGLDGKGRDFLQAMLVCLAAAATWHRRHLDLLEARIAESAGEEQVNYRRVLENLRNVPENPPATFYEAAQSLWFMFAFQRLCGTWSGVGRIDKMLGPCLERDLKENRLTLDEAREILAHFWVKGTEWIGWTDRPGSGDAQFYQNVVLAGVDEQGRPILNDVTWLVLDIVEELHISDFPIAVRVSDRTPRELLRRIAEVQRRGGGIVALYHDDVAIEGMVKLGYPLEEARGFANDGCWEIQAPGKTCFTYHPMDMLAMLQRPLGLDPADGPLPDYADFEALYGAFLAEVRRMIDSHNRGADAFGTGGRPTPLVSLLMEDCIEKARGYYEGGSRYRAFAPHVGGMANVAGSLMVIKKLVYDEKMLSLGELIEALRSDWEGHEQLRRLILSRFEFYGNDNEEADAMMRRVFDDYTAIVAEVPQREGVFRPAGISTFGREIDWRRAGYEGYGPRQATADGHHRGEYLATNCSPTPGADQKGPTAALNSYCKLDFTRTPNGATLELKLHPASVRGEEGIDAMVALMRSFIRQRGWFLHIDVVYTAMLLDAQRHPEKYPNLPVRVAGWSARFATLTKEWQDMVINRTQQVV